MMLTCRKDTNITKPEDFRGRTLGVWFGGNEYPFLSWMSHLKIPTEGGKDGVTVLKQGFNVDPLIQKQADCISTMTYNEYWQVIDAGIPADQLVVFPYEEQGVATLEDGLYVLEKSLDDPAMVDKLARFVRASMKGWKYASENPGKPPISCSTMMPPARRPRKCRSVWSRKSASWSMVPMALSTWQLPTARWKPCSAAVPIRSSPRSRKARGPRRSPTP